MVPSSILIMPDKQVKKTTAAPMLENCDTLLNATAVYHQNHYCATRSALGKVSESTATWNHHQLQTQEVRGSHRESVFTQQPPTHPKAGWLWN